MPERKPIVSGLILIVLGATLYLLQNTAFDEVVLFFLLGGAFVAASIYQRAYGLSIPGCIVLGVGVGMLAERGMLSVADAMPFGLGIGFLGIYALDLLYFGTGGWWPLIPGIILLLVGVGSELEIMEWLLDGGWPLLIVLAGVLIVVRALIGSRSPSVE